MALPAETPADLPAAAPAPLLSIIVVSYNTAQMTVEAIRSVYDTAGDLDFELFVYDNDSTDNSVEAIAAAFPAEDYPNLYLKAVGENLGFAKANNRAAKEARGQYLLLLNPDTVVLPGAIQALLAFARRRPEARIWGTRNILGDGSLDYGSCWGRMTPWSVFSYAVGLEQIFPNSTLFKPEGYGGWDRTTEREVDIVTGCFLLTDMALWRELGGFDERFFMYAEEADFCLRARALGAAPRFTPETEIVHYGGASDTLRAQKIAKIYAGKLTLAEKHWPAWQVSLARQFYKLAVLVRWSAYSLSGALRGKASHREAGREWRRIWGLRDQWIRGY